MSVLAVVGPKCTLAMSHAVPWRVTVSMATGWADAVKCFPLHAARGPIYKISYDKLSKNLR